MEQTKRLLMTFKTSDDKKVSLSIDDPREDITEGEKIKTLEMAKAMKDENVDIEIIAKVSGLSKEKIEML